VDQVKHLQEKQKQVLRVDLDEAEGLGQDRVLAFVGRSETREPDEGTFDVLELGDHDGVVAFVSSSAKS